MSAPLTDRTRWLAFAVVCLGDLMIVLDTTIVNVALPTIRDSLNFSETALVWVVNAYLLTFGGFLLLGGRLADFYGQRKLFVGGVAIFTLASLACGLAQNQPMLIIARAVQGLAGAVVSAVALSLIMTLFEEGPARVRAMGFFGFVMSAGGAVGVLAGGFLTGMFDWRSIFLVNLPIGAAVIFAALRFMPYAPGQAAGKKLDITGAALITGSLLLAVYAIVGAEQTGWLNTQTLGLLALAAGLMGVFVLVENKVRDPLVPFGLFKSRNVTTANVVGVLWAAAMFAWFFLSALYMQLVLGYDPMRVGLAFLPGNLIMGAFSYKLSAMMVNRFGLRWPAALGLAIAAVGLFMFSLAPVDGQFWLHIILPMTVLGVGAGMAFNPVLLSAMNDVKPEDAGLASGLVNTAFMMGGSLGLAILAGIAAAQTNSATAAGAEITPALHAGYSAAFLGGAVAAALAAALCALFIRERAPAEGAVAAH